MVLIRKLDPLCKGPRYFDAVQQGSRAPMPPYSAVVVRQSIIVPERPFCLPSIGLQWMRGAFSRGSRMTHHGILIIGQHPFQSACLFCGAMG